MGETKGKPLQMGETKRPDLSDTSSRQGMELFDSKQPGSLSELEAVGVDADIRAPVCTSSGYTMSKKEI